MKSVIATTALFGALASAQYAIAPDSVSNTTRQFWCQEQETQCPLICLQTAANSATTDSNTCDWQALTYSCVCSNGLSPNISEYSQTLPYFICTEWGQQCVSNCNGNNACASACTQNHPCGAQNPTKVNTSTITTTQSSSTSGGNAGATTDSAGQTIYTGFGGQAASTTGGGNGGSSSHSGASTLYRGWALSAGQTFGSIALVGAFIGGFAVVL